MHASTLEVPRLSPLRVGVGSGVIAAHVAVLLMMSMAVQKDFVVPESVVPKAIEMVEVVTRTLVPPAPPPPMPAAPPRARAPAQTPPVPVPAPVVPVESAFVIDSVIPTNPVTDAFATPGAPEGEADAAPVGGLAGLALLHAPEPPYPIRAKRLGWQGEVLLRIHVGADGMPREVRIVRSSGHAELDRSARAHVLRHWRFAPPQREAIGEVPIRFALL